MRRVIKFIGHTVLGVGVAVLVCLVSPLNNIPSLSVGEPAAIASKVNSSPPESINASHLLKQGRELYETGHFFQAVETWQQALETYQSLGDSLKQSEVMRYLSLAHQQLGQSKKANESIKASIDLLQTSQAQRDTQLRLPLLAQVLNTQGSLQLAQGQEEQALSSWQQAADIYAQAGDQAGRTGSLINQAQAQQSLGLYLRARQTLTKLEEELRKQPDQLLKSTGLLSLGNVLRLVGDLDKSRQVLAEGLIAAQQLASPPNISATLLSLGNTARDQQDTKAALEYYQQAITASNSSTGKVQARLNQFSLLLENQLWSDAQTLWPRIQAEIANLPPSRTGIYAQINFAQNLAKLRQTKDKNSPSWLQIAQIAAQASQQAETLGDLQAQAYALGSFGGIYELNKQWLEAQQLTEQALNLAQAINAPDISYRWQWQLGRLLKTQGDIKGAIAAYSEAVKTLKSLRSDLVAINSQVQFSFRDSVEPVYRELVGLLLREEATQKHLEQARKVIESLQVAELDNFFRAACLDASPLQIEEIDAKAALIYPIILEDRLEVILSLPAQPLRHYATSLEPGQVRRTLALLRETLTKRNAIATLPLAQQVYEWLIRPAEEYLAEVQVETLTFVLDGSLRNIPMAVLYDGQQYLVEKYAIALTPGLELLKSYPLKRGEIKVLKAGLSQARLGFESIPYVEAEIKQIQSQIPGEVLLNQDFTKTQLRHAIDQAPFPIIHLATHGQFSSEAEDTFILTWDEKINVEELSELLQTADLQRSKPIELLVLSACETAQGDNRAALGLAGVAVKAGVRSTIATLWLVDDQATANLMSRFYEELSKSEVTKAEALRRAQLSVLQNPQYERNPFYWAPFVLVGNWL
ncbi:MAG: CHAT domain-containing protein [Coleofasciculaceae cyanobacterium]